VQMLQLFTLLLPSRNLTVSVTIPKVVFTLRTTLDDVVPCRTKLNTLI